MNFEEYYYIPLNPGSKRPMFEFSGWPVDPDHENVYTYAGTQDIDHTNWAIIGHQSSELLVLDIDAYKMTDEELERIDGEGWGGLLDVTTVVRSQSGGLHVYVFTDVDIYDTNIVAVDNVDLKGDVGKGYAVAPFSPGYELAQDSDPLPVSEDTLRDLPVLEETVNLPDLSDAWMDEERPWVKTEPMETPCITYAKEQVTTRGDDFDDALAFLKRYYRNLSLASEDIRDIINESDFMQVAKDYIHVHEVTGAAGFPMGQRVEHPEWLHNSPSESGANFMVDDGGETWRCWRHDVTGNALHLVGVKHGVIECGDWKGNRSLGSNCWAQIIQNAEEMGLDVETSKLTCEWTQDLGICPFECGRPYPKGGN